MTRWRACESRWKKSAPLVRLPINSLSDRAGFNHPPVLPPYAGREAPGGAKGPGMLQSVIARESGDHHVTSIGAKPVTRGLPDAPLSRSMTPSGSLVSGRTPTERCEKKRLQTRFRILKTKFRIPSDR